VLIIALVVLVAMTLSALALIRSVNSVSLVSGNMAFRGAALLSAEHGTEEALSLLKGRTRDELSYPIAGFTGYFAKIDDSEDWNAFFSGEEASFRSIATDTAGNTVSYVIHRMCREEGPPTQDSSRCARPPMGSSGGSHMGGELPLPSISQVYYRITCRVEGPRRTVAYTQAIIAI
jgi:hypothetical protein